MREKAAPPAVAGKGTTPVVLKNRKLEWAAAVFSFALLFLFFWQYHHWRGRSYDAYSANKAMAASAALLLCAALALGPLDRLTKGLPRLLRLRRPFGVTGAMLAASHILIAISAVERFDAAYYREHWPAWICGGAAVTGFIFLWGLSYEKEFTRIGRERWKRIHRWGWFFLALVAGHILFLGKAPEWVEWFRTGKEPVPPGTVIPAAAIFATLALRFAEHLVLSRWGRHQ